MAFPVDFTSLINDDYQSRKMSLYGRNGDVYLVIHHAVAYTVDQIIATFNSPNRTVSANFAIGPHRAGVNDYKIARTVQENMRAYTTASWVDDQALTVEVANLSMGGSYPVGSTGKQILAELAAYMHKEYNMPLDRWHVTSHREVYQRGWGSYATACPGDDLQSSLDWIVAEAKRIVASGSGTAGGGGTIIDEEEDEMKVVFGHRNEGGDEWMIGHPDFKGERDFELGFLVTTDANVAKSWGRIYSKGSNAYDFDVNRKDYIEIQKSFTRSYQAKNRAEAQRLRDAQVA